MMKRNDVKNIYIERLQNILLRDGVIEKILANPDSRIYIERKRVVITVYVDANMQQLNVHVVYKTDPVSLIRFRFTSPIGDDDNKFHLSSL